MDNLHGWVFTYNAFEKNWHATTRDNYRDMFSNSQNKTIIKSSDIDTLIKVIIKGKGNLQRILA